MYLEIRHKKLINILITSSTQYCTGKKIAEVLNVSRRTVQNDIKYINSFQNLIKSKRGLGYFINNTKAAINFLNINNVVANRDVKIIKEILLHKEYPLDKCIDKFFISESTLINSVKQFNEFLENESFDANIFISQNNLVCKSSDLEKMCILQRILLTEVENNNFDLKILEQYFIWLNIKLLKDIILKYEKMLNSCLDNYELITIILQAIILLDSYQTGNLLHLYHGETTSYNEKLKLFDDIELTQKIKLDHHVIFELMGILDNTNTKYKKTFYKNKEEILKIANKMFGETTDLNNSSFKNNFVKNLIDLIWRVKTRQPMKNPILKEVKGKFPFIYDLSKSISYHLQKKFQILIPEDEVSYISLDIINELKKNTCNSICILLINPYYSESLTTYISKIIKKYNPNIKIKLSHGLNYETDLDNDIDGIISCVQIIKLLNMPTLCINNIDDLNDNIYKFISKISKRNNLSYLEINKYFSEDFFYPQISATDKKEILAMMCRNLKIKKIINDDFFKKVLEKEIFAPTSFGNLTAISCPLNINTRKKIISVAILRRPIQWDSNNKVQMIFLLAFNSNDSIEIDKTYKYILNLVNDKKTKEKLKNITNFSDFQKILL